MSEQSGVFDSVLDLCRHQHRRIALRALATEQRSLTLDELTAAVLEHDHQSSPSEAPEDVVTEIRLSLHHVHLPKLAAEGFVNHDFKRKLVEPTERLGRIRPALSTILDADPSLEASMSP